MTPQHSQPNAEFATVDLVPAGGGWPTAEGIARRIRTMPQYTPGPWRIGFEDGTGWMDDDDGAWIIGFEEEVVVAGGSHEGLKYGVPDEHNALSDRRGTRASRSGEARVCLLRDSRGEEGGGETGEERRREVHGARGALVARHPRASRAAAASDGERRERLTDPVIQPPAFSGHPASELFSGHTRPQQKSPAALRRGFRELMQTTGASRSQPGGLWVPG